MYLQNINCYIIDIRFYKYSKLGQFQFHFLTCTSTTLVAKTVIISLVTIYGILVVPTLFCIKLKKINYRCEDVELKGY